MINFLNNKYTRLYYKIIEKARKAPHEGYIENHHIIPKALNGDNTLENRVDLSGRQHFICHWLLIKMIEGTQKRSMARAFSRMMDQKSGIQKRYKPRSARVYQVAREAANKAMRGKKHTQASIDLMRKNRAVKGWSGKANSMYGKTHSEETRKKIGDKQRGRIHSEEEKEKRALFHRGRKRSEETKRKMREAWIKRRQNERV